jgi:hypothetical protein
MEDLRLHMKWGKHSGKSETLRPVKKTFKWEVKRLRGKEGKCETCGKITELFKIRTRMGTTLLRCYNCLENLRRELRKVEFEWVT